MLKNLKNKDKTLSNSGQSVFFIFQFPPLFFLAASIPKMHSGLLSFFQIMDVFILQMACGFFPFLLGKRMENHYDLDKLFYSLLKLVTKSKSFSHRD